MPSPIQVDISSFTPEQQAAFNRAAALAPPGSIQGQVVNPNANFFPAISTNSLISNNYPNLAAINPPVDNTNHNAIVASGQGQIDQNNKALASSVVSVPAVPTDLKAYFEKYLAASTPPTSVEPLYQTARESAGLDVAQQVALQKQSAVKAAQTELAGVQAQIQSVINKREANNLKLEGQASKGQIVETILNRQQAEVNRQSAIEALPLQSLALAKQAQLASLQGEAEFAQSSLKLAQDKLDIMFKLKSEDATNTYNYWKDLRDKVFEFAKEAEKIRIEKQQKTDDKAFQSYKDAINDAQTIKNKLYDSGQIELATEVGKRIASSTYITGQGDTTLANDVAEIAKKATATGSLIRAIVNPITGEITYYSSKGGAGSPNLPVPGGKPTGQPSGQPTPPKDKFDLVPNGNLIRPAQETVMDQTYIDLGKVREVQIPLAQRVANATGLPLLSKGDSDKVQEANQTYQSARTLINQIKNLTADVITADNNRVQMALQATKLYAIEKAPALSRDNNAKQFISVKQALLSLITRAAGEKGTLTNIDVGRIANALPAYGDNKELAIQKANNLDDIIKSVFTGSIRAYIGSAIQSQSQQPQPQSQFQNTPKLLQPSEIPAGYYQASDGLLYKK